MKLVHKITLAFLATLLLVVAIVAASLYVSVERGFSSYVRSLEESRLDPAVRRLTAIYTRDGDWHAIEQDPRRLPELLRREDDDSDRLALEQRPRYRHGPPRGGPPRDRPPPNERAGGTDPLELPPRVTLYEAGGRVIAGSGTQEGDASKLPLIVDGQTVGWLGLRAITRFDEEVDLKYMREVRGQLLVIALVAVLVGLLASWLLTRRLVRPLDALSTGARRLTSGDYEARIGLVSDDEFGRLARDFDALARTLGEDSRARRQWVADTSHELRTPIAVLRGEVEALQDGVRPVTGAALESLHAEIARLSKLVEDLGELARSDRGTLTATRVPIELKEVLRESAATFQPRFDQRRITIELAVEGAPRVSADRLRLQQVFSNLLENTLRYTDEGGVLRVSSTSEPGWLTLRFDDSPPGVPAEALPRLFERFYRADPSRARAHGGSGLGLSIAQRLIEGHGGTMVASAGPLGGLRIEMRLPLAGDTTAQEAA